MRCPRAAPRLASQRGVVRARTHTVEASGPFDHATAKGYVAPHKGQYADALSKGSQVWVLVAEVTGALDATVAALLRLLGSRAKIKGHRDGTVYGASRMATRDFATHHMRVLSLAIASSVGESIVHHARSIKSGPSTMRARSKAAWRRAAAAAIAACSVPCSATSCGAPPPSPAGT